MFSRSVILEEGDLREAVKYFSEQDEFVFDVEATGPNRGLPHLNDLTWISLATKGAVIVVPFGHPIGSDITGYTDQEIPWGKGKRTLHVPVYGPPPAQIKRETVFGILQPLFFREDIRKIAHGACYDLGSVAKYLGAVPSPPFGCTVTEQWLLKETFAQDKGLKSLAREKYGFEYDNEDVGKSIEKYPFSTVAYYSYCDALYPWFLHADFMPQIRLEGLEGVYNLEMDVLNVVVGMRLAGARLDMDTVRKLRENLIETKAYAENRVYSSAGHKFNLNSPPQKQIVLFDEQGLDPWKKTAKGGRSTDDDVLQSHKGNPVVDALIDYGDAEKLLSTYIEPWLRDTHDGRIYAEFVPYGTVTGRFSCRRPNLQNIPRPGTEFGTLIRGAFIADPHGKLIVADYSQIELVVLAHFLGSGALFDAFHAGVDPHRLHAAYVLDKNPEDVTSKERQDLGKTLGFAVCYGAGPKKVATMAGVSEERAKEILAAFDQRFPEVPAYKQAVLRAARRYNPPHIKTLLGRRRRLPELRDDRSWRAERQAFNALIQGSAADLIKLAMVRVDGMLPPGVECILSVHDEIVLSAPEDLAEDSAAILTEAMTGRNIQALLSVPLKAEVKIVDRWSEAK